jgi:hypothetical protein
MMEEVRPVQQSNKKIYIIIGIISLVILVAIISLILLFASSKEDSTTDEEGSPEITEDVSESSGIIDKEKIIRCGDIPKDFNAQDKTYLESNPQVKVDLLCISEAFSDCKEANIKFLSDEFYYYFKVKPEETSCKVSYQFENKAIECTYTKEQTKMLHEVAIEHEQPWVTGFSIMFSMGIELLRFEDKKIIEQTITNKDTLAKEKISCKYYWEGISTRVKENAPETIPETEESTAKIEYEGETIIAWGQEFEQGVAVYNQYDPEACGYSVYFSCDIFEDGCYDDSRSSFCYQSCINTGGEGRGSGTEYGKSGSATLTNNVIQCSCLQC